METIDAAERPGQGVFCLCGRHRRRLSVDDLCRPASCRRAWGRARSDQHLSSGIHPCTISLRRRGRKLEELAVAERAGTVAEVQINRRPKARPSIVRDARERRVRRYLDGGADPAACGGRPKPVRASSVCQGRQAGSAATRLASSTRSAATFSRCVRPVAGSRSSGWAAKLALAKANAITASAILIIAYVTPLASQVGNFVWPQSPGGRSLARQRGPA